MRRSLVLSLLLLASLVATGIVIAAGSSEPDRPAWVGTDGALRGERLPAFFEVAGPDGANVVCANGKRLKVRSSELFGPPPAAPDVLLRQQQRGNEELVWRCGKGSNAHLDARLVPAAQDPLRNG